MDKQNSNNFFQNILKDLQLDYVIKELSDNNRTANDAASAIGCNINQIAK